MTTKNIQKYAESNWSQYLAPITEISKSGNERGSLINSEKTIYSFDDICRDLFPVGQVPASADGLSISADAIELIEFKTGFKQRVTKKNFDEQKGTCPRAGVVCEDYWNVFFDNQRRKIQELIASIRFKATESYIAIEKQVLPLCDNLEMQKTISIRFTVVVDEDGIDSMEDTLTELAGTEDVEDNCFKSIKQALSRLKGRQDAKGNTYYYDAIEVISAQDFSNRLRMQA